MGAVPKDKKAFSIRGSPGVVKDQCYYRQVVETSAIMKVDVPCVIDVRYTLAAAEEMGLHPPLGK